MDDHDAAKVRKAAAQIEELAADMKQAVITMREARSKDEAYAVIYHIRTDLGRIISTLGFGVPRRFHYEQKNGGD